MYFSVLPPFFEADYLELVKDLPEISLGPSSGYEKYSKLSVYGPDAFPILTDNDGYAYVVAGKFGEVSNFMNISLRYYQNEFKILAFQYPKHTKICTKIFDNLGQVHDISMGRRLLATGNATKLHL